ncbi:hypothetical protein M405DRAFT_857010 [Rhizopogon salebrosus TDB-379]|nr:hypothetical protein M405DRAFT_857010 [Rhizopogon salebrosus TDB-379]
MNSDIIRKLSHHNAGTAHSSLTQSTSAAKTPSVPSASTNISRRPISSLWLILAFDSTTQPVVSIKPDVITPFEAGFEKGIPCLLCCPEDRLARKSYDSVVVQSTSQIPT